MGRAYYCQLIYFNILPDAVSAGSDIPILENVLYLFHAMDLLVILTWFLHAVLYPSLMPINSCSIKCDEKYILKGFI